MNVRFDVRPPSFYKANISHIYEMNSQLFSVFNVRLYYRVHIHIEIWKAAKAASRRLSECALGNSHGASYSRKTLSGVSLPALISFFA